MAIIIDGKKEAQRIEETLTGKITAAGILPRLVIIQIGDRLDSGVYIRQKKKFGEKIGAVVDHVQYPETISQDVVISHIKKYNEDSSVHGIIIQLPLPLNFNKISLIESIAPKKDVDGLTGYNRSLLLENDARAIVPATTRGIFTLLDRYSVTLEGKKVVVIGRSALVGKPTALVCMNRNATVTVCHRKSKRFMEDTRSADILIVAAGQKGLINRQFVSAGQVVIDVGINVIEDEGNRNISGDVVFSEVERVVYAITPVPGGVGPMTVASLFENVVEAAIKSI